MWRTAGNHETQTEETKAHNLNVPEEITIANVTNVIKAQNPDIGMNGEEITAKFRYKTRKGNYNIVIEVGPQTRKQILHTKLKIGLENAK